jgi:molybdopterin molybdotransferase
MLSVDDALKIILTNIKTTTHSEMVNLFNCYGRFIFNDIVSGFNVPSKNNSSMDGYAVKSEDTKTATRANPVILKIIDEVQAGNEFSGEKLHTGHAIRIMTGAPIPEGTDCVIPFEETEESGNTVKIFKSAIKYEFIRFAGEDVKKGENILKRGTRIDSAEAGLLASINLSEMEVFKKPEVAIISTGNELDEPGKNYTGKVINSNAYVLYSEIMKYGGNPYYAGIVRDKYEDVRQKFLDVIDKDVILSSGGVSMGRYDFIPEALKEIGIDLKINTVAMKPGKPIVFGTSNNKLFFGLPGNPVSVMVSFLQFVRPALLKMSGCTRINKPVLNAQITEDINKLKGRRHFVRGIFTIKEGKLFVRTTGSQSSGILKSMSDSNCLIIIPEDVEFIKSGTYVQIQLIGHNEIQ